MRRLTSRNKANVLQLQTRQRFLRQTQVPEMNGVKSAAEDPNTAQNVLRSSTTDMPITQHHKLLRGQPFQADWSTGMDFIGGYADFRTQPIFETIGETRRGIHHHAARIHFAKEASRPAVVFGHDSVGMFRALGVDVFNRLIQIGHHAHR